MILAVGSLIALVVRDMRALAIIYALLFIAYVAVAHMAPDHRG